MPWAAAIAAVASMHGGGKPSPKFCDQCGARLQDGHCPACHPVQARRSSNYSRRGSVDTTSGYGGYQTTSSSGPSVSDFMPGGMFSPSPAPSPSYDPPAPAPAPFSSGGGGDFGGGGASGEF